MFQVVPGDFRSAPEVFGDFFGRPKGVLGVPKAFQNISQMSQGIAGGFRVTSGAYQECFKDFRSLSRFKGIAWVL